MRTQKLKEENSGTLARKVLGALSIIMIALKICSVATAGPLLTLLHAFNGADGNIPNELTWADDGWIYGTAAGGGRNGSGVIFKFDSTGNFNLVYDGFDSRLPSSGANPNPGSAPSGGIAVASDGSIYGSTK